MLYNEDIIDEATVKTDITIMIVGARTYNQMLYRETHTGDGHRDWCMESIEDFNRAPHLINGLDFPNAEAFQCPTCGDIMICLGDDDMVESIVKVLDPPHSDFIYESRQENIMEFNDMIMLENDLDTIMRDTKGMDVGPSPEDPRIAKVRELIGFALKEEDE